MYSLIGITTLGAVTIIIMIHILIGDIIRVIITDMPVITLRIITILITVIIITEIIIITETDVLT